MEMQEIDWGEIPGARVISRSNGMTGTIHSAPGDIEAKKGLIMVRLDANSCVYWMDKKEFQPLSYADWSGEGLPPVGTVCELKFEHWKDWESCEVLCYGKAMVFVRQTARSGSIFEGSMNLDGVTFRPIRTPEQIAEEERESHVLGMLCHDAFGGTRRGLAEALYDAGYRKTGDLQ